MAVLMDGFDLAQWRLPWGGGCSDYPDYCHSSYPGPSMTPVMRFAQRCLDYLDDNLSIIVSILDSLEHCDERICWPCLNWCWAKSWQILWHLKNSVSMPYFYAGPEVSVFYAFICSGIWVDLGGLWEVLVFIWFSQETVFSMIPCSLVLFWYRLSVFSVWKLVDVSENMLINGNVRRE